MESVNSAGPQGPRQDSFRARKAFECAEVFGGNRAVDVPIVLPGISGCVRSIPCQSRIGGDIHYISTCGSGLMSRFAVADVVGHGADVQAVSTHAHDLLRQFMNAIDHREALETLNDRLTTRGLEALTTAAVFTFFPPTRTLSFSYAGHPPAWFYSRVLDRWIRLELRAGRSAAGERESDFPLAVSDDTRYSIDQIRVVPGDRLIVISDGLTDAMDASRNIFGAKRVESILERCSALSEEAIVGTLLHALADFCGSRSFTHDDVTIIALRFEPITKLECTRLILKNRVLRPVALLARRVWNAVR